MNPYTDLINQYKSVVAGMAGASYSFTIKRIPYTTGDNSGTVVATGVAAHVEPAGPNWAQDKIPDAEFFEVCTDPSLFQEGDLFDSGADIPKVTIFSCAEGQEFLAIKTDKLCTIKDIGREWQNVPFDYMNSTSAGPDEYRDENTSLNVATRRVVMYQIPEVTEAMQFFDNSTGVLWDIGKVDFKAHVMELFLDEQNRT